ncbi:MAG: ATP-binding cassette domain-containing protein [Magnetococcales bacterium]|nr:ATP-binding cassette domain-containing protein [Magnetococcales bacterium]
MAFLRLQGLSKSYGTHKVLDGIQLEVAQGEFVAILGFSGTGKSTLIGLIAGLIRPDAGEITLREKPIRGPGPDRGVVFQNYALMPWMTVRENVALAVRGEGLNAVQRAAVVDEFVALVGLAHAADRHPAELSGGMRQRVSVARALAMQPEILLLDEPLSALDALTRARLQDEFDAIRGRDGKTVVLITNDVDEALLLADRVIPLLPGAAGATLGRPFAVDFPRPRARKQLEHRAEYKALRAEITRFMIHAGEQRAHSRESLVSLPDIKPRFPGEGPPKAYLDAAQGARIARYVEFDGVIKSFSTPEGPLTVVDGFNLHMDRGECVTLIGHSGCGKSTVLSMVAGLVDVTGGGIVLNGREVSSAGPDRAVVFQSPSLFPWLTARENVALGVERVYPHATRTQREDVVSYYLAKVGLGDAMERRAAEMSNGMRQRVGIARAFALSPKLLLLDEPFGMLDSLTRWELQEVLMEVWSRTRVTAICVTHDVDEAILLADRVVMMTNGPHARIGRIMRVDLPRPRTRAALLSHPKYYEYRAELIDFLEEYEKGHAGGGRQAA